MAWAEVTQWFRNASSATSEPSMRALANGMLELTKQVRRMDRKLAVLEQKLDGLSEGAFEGDPDRKHETQPSTHELHVGLV